jgi:hypothetical protein
MDARLGTLADWVRSDMIGLMIKSRSDSTTTSPSKLPLNTTSILAGVPAGKRNAALFAYACRLRNLVTSDECCVLVSFAGAEAKPPYPDPDDEPIADMVERIYTTYANPPESPKETVPLPLSDEDLEADCPIIDVFAHIERPAVLLGNDEVPDLLCLHELAMIYADPGVGKSLLIVDMAIALMTGRPWLGFRSTKIARVLYLDAEMGDWRINERFEALCAPSKIEMVRESLTYRRVGMRSFLPPQLDTPAGCARLDALIKRTKADLVVIDPFSAFFGGDENDNIVMGAVCRRTRNIAVANNAAALVVHHCRKSQDDTRSGHGKIARGASAIKGALDSMFCLSLLGDERGPRLLEQFKTRGLGGSLPPTEICLSNTPEWSGGKEFHAVEHITACGKADNAIPLIQAFIAHHPAHMATTKEVLAERVAQNWNLSERSLKAALSAGIESGLWIRLSQGHYKLLSQDPS